MTREEFKKSYNFGNTGGVVKVDILIDDIYDDFESRTCENCRYYIKATYGEYKNMCSFGIDIRVTPTSSFSGTPSNFGCNKFERKTDGDV